MTPHTSGTSLSAQTRYAAGVREIQNVFLMAHHDGLLPIVQNGQLAGMVPSYSRSSTSGSEEAANYQK